MQRYFILVFDIIKQWRPAMRVQLPRIRDTVGTFMIYMSVFALLLAVSSTLLTYRSWREQQESRWNVPKAMLVIEQQKPVETDAAPVSVGKRVTDKEPSDKINGMPVESKQESFDTSARVGETQQEKIGKPLSGKIRAAYGWREDPVYKDWRFHAGVDIQAGKGSEVHAVKSGKVVDVCKNDSGVIVKIEHNDGMLTIYGHIEEYYIRVGQFVGQGQVLGRLGTAGEIYLHFEIWQANRSIDPTGIIGE